MCMSVVCTSMVKKKRVLSFEVIHLFFALYVFPPVNIPMDIYSLLVDFLSLHFWIFLPIREVPNIFNCFLWFIYAFNWSFLLAIYTTPGVWALHLWSNGTLCSNIFILESIWLTNSACSFLSWKFSFIGSAAFLQCSGMMLEIFAKTLVKLKCKFRTMESNTRFRFCDARNFVFFPCKLINWHV